VWCGKMRDSASSHTTHYISCVAKPREHPASSHSKEFASSITLDDWDSVESTEKAKGEPGSAAWW